MITIKNAAEDFLAHKRIAVTGVSRSPKDHGANFVYRRLRDRGYEVFAVNPNAAEVEGDKAYGNLTSSPGGVEAVVIGTSPEHADEAPAGDVEPGRAWHSVLPQTIGSRCPRDMRTHLFPRPEEHGLRRPRRS